jgi:hypothetical protein
MKPTSLLLGALFFGIYGCGLLSRSIPIPTTDLQGSIQDNVYTSPTGTFRVRLPALSSDGIEISDEMVSRNTMRLTIKDNLCREFIVSQRPGFLGTKSLAEWVEQQIVNPLKSEGFKIEPPKPVQLHLGSAISLRYKVTGGAPCVVTSVKNDKRVESKPDADVGWYVFHHEGSFYRLIYVLGLGTKKRGTGLTRFLIKREPVDEVLAEFAEGFDFVDPAGD